MGSLWPVSDHGPIRILVTIEPDPAIYDDPSEHLAVRCLEAMHACGYREARVFEPDEALCDPQDPKKERTGQTVIDTVDSTPDPLPPEPGKE